MGNCANKPATAEGEAPVVEEKAVESTEREIVLETNKVIPTHVNDDDVTTPRSLAQMLLEDEEKKPEVEAAKPAEATPSTAAVAEPVKVEASETKAAEVAAPAPVVVEAPPAEKKAEEKK